MHSPTPGKAHTEESPYIEDAEGKLMLLTLYGPATMGTSQMVQQTKANRDLILERVNGWDEMVKATDLADKRHHSGIVTLVQLVVQRKALKKEVADLKAQLAESEQKVEDHMNSYDELTVLWNNTKVELAETKARLADLEAKPYTKMCCEPSNEDGEEATPENVEAYKRSHRNPDERAEERREHLGRHRIKYE